MVNSNVPGSNQNINVQVRALTPDPNVTVQYKTKILQKNVVNGVNTLTQEMISEANMKYVIKYNYVLGEDITIPENCILEFDGGSISGTYTITGANTGINAGLVKIFNTDITLAGSWNVREAYPEWFGAIGNNSNDDTIYIQKSVDTLTTTNISTIYLTSKYVVSSPIIIKDRRIVIKGSVNIYEDYNLFASSFFTPVTIDGKEIKSVIALTKPIEIFNIGINGNGVANCIQWYAGWAAGCIEGCQLFGAIGAAIAGGVTETFYIRHNFIHSSPIGIRFARRFLSVANNKDFSIFGLQANNPEISGAFYGMTISDNVIECRGINIFLHGGGNVNILNNLTAHSQIWGYYLNELAGINITGNYSEGEGVCTGNGFADNSGTQPVGPANQELIDNNLNGIKLNNTECIRAAIYMFDCHYVHVDSSYFSYKKHSGIGVFNTVDRDLTKAGVDSHIIIDFSTDIILENTKYYNWNGNNMSGIVYEEAIINDIIPMRVFPKIQIDTRNRNPICLVEDDISFETAFPQIKINTENIHSVVDFSANRYRTDVYYELSGYTYSLSDMPITEQKTVGTRKYYSFNSKASIIHFAVVNPDYYRGINIDYLEVILPIINTETDINIGMEITTYTSGSVTKFMSFKNNDRVRQNDILIAFIPIDPNCSHTDLAIWLYGAGNNYQNVLFGLPTVNYIGCNKID